MMHPMPVRRVKDALKFFASHAFTKKGPQVFRITESLKKWKHGTTFK